MSAPFNFDSLTISPGQPVSLGLDSDDIESGFDPVDPLGLSAFSYLETGPSPAGWSRLSTYMKCPYLFGRRYFAPIPWEQLRALAPRRITGLEPDSATSLGTTGHAGMAHWLAHAAAAQGGCVAADQWVDSATVAGRNPGQSALADPLSAIEDAGQREGVSRKGIDSVIAAFRSYIRENPEPRGRVLAVESLILAVVGEKRRADGTGHDFGLWVVKTLGREWDTWLESIDGQPVKVRRLEGLPRRLDGSPNPYEGRRVIITRRLDATLADRPVPLGALEAVTSQAQNPRGGIDLTRWQQLTGAFLHRIGVRVDVDDHKFSALPFSSAKIEHYEMDGQFSLAREMSRQLYGDAFSETWLNAIHRVGPYTHGRAVMPVTSMDRQLAWQVLQWEEDIGQQLRVPDIAYWKKHMRETNCKSGEGWRCDLYWHCRDE